jgi:hypothetical protein
MAGDSASPADDDARLERALLEEVVFLHPAHLTLAELTLKMDAPDGSESIAIENSLETLKRAGLVRVKGDVVEPTYAALRVAGLFQWFGSGE